MIENFVVQKILPEKSNNIKQFYWFNLSIHYNRKEFESAYQQSVVIQLLSCRYMNLSPTVIIPDLESLHHLNYSNSLRKGGRSTFYKELYGVKWGKIFLEKKEGEKGGWTKEKVTLLWWGWKNSVTFMAGLVELRKKFFNRCISFINKYEIT